MQQRLQDDRRRLNETTSLDVGYPRPIIHERVEKKMRFALFLLLTVTTVLATSGCYTLRPANAKERPLEVAQNVAFQDEFARIQESVTTRVVVHPPFSEDPLVRNLHSSLTSLYDRIGNYQQVARGDSLAQLWEELKLATDPNAPRLLEEKLSTNIDQLIKYEVVSDHLVTRGAGLVTTSVNPRQSQAGRVRVDVQAVGFNSGDVILSRSLTGTSAYRPVDASNVDTGFDLKIEAIEDAVAQFQNILSKTYPPAVILSTRGGGRLAHISRGTSTGLEVGDSVEIFMYSRGDTGEVYPLKYGRVIAVEEDRAWVDVLRWRQKPVVTPGLYVRNNTFPSGLGSRIRDYMSTALNIGR